MEKYDILIVDDTPGNLQFLAKMLLEKGYVVRPVTNGRAALEIARANPPDLILLDINMPDMDGYEVCTQLKSNDRLKEIPVIFLTAMTDEADKVKAFSLGGVDYITKPFELHEVEARIKTHLTICMQKKRLQESLEEKYRNIFEHAIEGIFQMAPDGKFITANPQCALIYGYRSPDEMIAEINAGKRKIYASKNAYEQFLRTLETRGSISMFETQAVRNNGEVIWISINARAIRSDEDKILYYDGFMEDTTERKEAEEKLQRSEAELRALIASMNDVILAINKEGTCIRIPDTSADPLYKPSVDFIGRKLWEIFPELPGDKYLPVIQLVLRTKTSANLQYRLLTNESERWFSAVISPMTHDSVLWVARDITELKTTEQSLKINSQRLDETNIALKVLIRNLQESKREQEGTISTNFNSLVLPYLQKIESLKLSEVQQKYMNMVKKNLHEIISPFIKDMNQYNLTPTELEVAYYIKDGKSTKEMANILNTSIRSIDFHRYNIRKKLHINNDKVNLRSHLLSLESRPKQ